MELLTVILFGITTAVSGLLFLDKLFPKLRYRLPPGPRGLPLLGCPWYMFRDIHIIFTELAEIWGDCFSVNILGQRMVVLNTPEVVREAYRKGVAFAGRTPHPSYINQLENSTVFLAPNQQWTKQRKLIHRILNMYGEGVQAGEGVIHEELSHVAEWLEKHQDSPVNLDDVIFPAVTNVLTILLQGRRYEYDSRVLKNIQTLDEAVIRAYSPVSRILFAVFPFLQRVNVGPGKDALLSHDSSEQFVKDMFDETKATYSPDVTRGMIDHLLRYCYETQQKEGAPWLEEKFIKSMIMETVAAGSITTRISLNSFFLIMIYKPAVAKQIQNEIDTVIGRSRLAKLQDRSLMPYTSAAILETLRYISHVPLGLPHVTTCDVTFNDFVLPKGTALLANTWRYHHDNNLWSEPWEFKPERFLDEDGNLLPADHPNRKNLQPFGVGIRSCVGETFAKSRIFLFIVTLLQRFDFVPDPTRPPPPCDPRSYNSDVTLSPRPYYVRVKSRD